MNHKQLAKLNLKMAKFHAQWNELNAAIDEAIMEIVTKALKEKIAKGYTIIQAEAGLQGYEIVIETAPDNMYQGHAIQSYHHVQALLEQALPDLKFETYAPQDHKDRWRFCWIAHN